MRNFIIIILLVMFYSCQYEYEKAEIPLRKVLDDYREELNEFKSEFGGSRRMPNIKWFQFGMGNRTKLLYKEGAIINSITHETLYKWQIDKEYILPSEYKVVFKTIKGNWIEIVEDTTSVRIIQNIKNITISGTESKLKLPNFDEYKYPNIMKVLHHEILINILESKPLPNFFVYNKPWRRDAAMMAMCLKKTKNLELIEDWVLSIDEPYDYNNAGEAEADNLGQTLYILSLFSSKNKELVEKILYEIKKFEVNGDKGTYILGKSDFHEAPVYQTKWLKFGLKSMNLPDKYEIPELEDDYSALFWWDYKSNHINTKDADNRGDYTYLGWACDHFYGKKQSPISNRDYPLTWEIKASQANYKGMSIIDSKYKNKQNSSPHTWHASEIFLYLMEPDFLVNKSGSQKI